MRLVPDEPTQVMLRAGNSRALDVTTLMDDTEFACERATYKAMIESAPAFTEFEAALEAAAQLVERFEKEEILVTLPIVADAIRRMKK